MNTKTSRSDSDLETKQSGAGASDSLRRSAEQMLRTTRADISEMTPENVQRVIYELQVHQMELQLQNEELRDAQVALAETRDRYADLYEFAPVGYITLDQEGTILEGNLTAASMLPLDRNKLLGQNLAAFLSADSQDEWYLHRLAVFSGETKQTARVQLRTDGPDPLFLRLESIAFDLSDQRRCRTAMIDITERTRAEESLRRLNVELEDRVNARTAALTAANTESNRTSQRIREILNKVDVVISEWDLQTRLPSFVNERAEEILGYPLKDWFDSPDFWEFTLLHPEDREQASQFCATQTRAGSDHELAYRVKRADGSVMWLHEFVKVIKDKLGTPVRLVCVMVDNTHRVHVENELRREHEFKEKVINTAQNIVLVLDVQGRIVQFNTYLEQLSGWKFDQVKGKDWFETFIPKSDRSRLRVGFSNAIDGRLTSGKVNAILTREGQRRHIEWHDAQLTNEDGAVIGLLCTGQDITDRKELERHVLQIAGDEQRRIGIDLHDGVGQQLTGLGMMADTLLIALQRKSLRESDFAEKLCAGLKQTLGDVRKLARGLSPIQVDGEGLRCATEELLTQASELYGFKYQFRYQDGLEIADAETATQLYRICQEAMNNAVKHGQARNLEVCIEKLDGKIELRVKDDGTGIDQKISEGIGLRSMGYRAGVIGGELRVSPARDGGTRVVCSLNADKEADRVSRK